MTRKTANTIKTKKTGNQKKRRPLWTYWRFWLLAGGGLAAFYAVIFLIGGIIYLVKPDTVSAARKEAYAVQQSAQISSNTKENNVIKKELVNSTEIVEWLNGSRTEKIGEVTVTKVPYAAVNDEYFQEWWEEYGSNPAYNAAFIVYTDKENEGIDGLPSAIAYKDTGLVQDQWGDCMLG